MSVFDPILFIEPNHHIIVNSIRVYYDLCFLLLFFLFFAVLPVGSSEKSV